MVGLYFLRIVMGILMALITGFMAKGSVVSTLSILFGSTESLLAAISPLAAVSLPVFSLLYTPCVAAVSSIKRELSGKWTLYVVIGQCVIAWIVALVVRLLGMAIGIFLSTKDRNNFSDAVIKVWSVLFQIYWVII